MTVKLYSDAACSAEIGTGPKADFEGIGIAATVATNAVTTIYGKAIDDQGDQSICNYLTSFVHDTVAPATGSFVSANPVSPTAATLYPRISGVATGTQRPFDSTIQLRASRRSAQEQKPNLNPLVY